MYHFEPNRRVFPRFQLAFPVKIDAPERPNRVGVTRDLSRSGALLLSNSLFHVGDRLSLTLGVNESCSGGPGIDGEVVRVLPAAQGTTWNWATAVEFDRPLPAAALRS